MLCENTSLHLQVVPEGLRSSVYAFDRCFEGALSALSAPLVGLIAERWFGYTTHWGDPTPSRQLSNARALGNGLLVSQRPVNLSQSRVPDKECLHMHVVNRNARIVLPPTVVSHCGRESDVAVSKLCEICFIQVAVTGRPAVYNPNTRQRHV